MKDFLGSDRFGFERVVMQVLAPGLVALGPFVWLIYLVHRGDILLLLGDSGPAWIRSWADANGDGVADPRPLMDFVRVNKTLAITVVMLCAILVGLVIEDAGAWIERNVFDPVNLRRKDRNLRVVWYAYLRANDQKDTKPAVAPKYMSAVLPRMKFQLSLGIALLFFSVGLMLLTHFALLKLVPQVIGVIIGTMVLGSVFQFRKALSYCTFLHELRVCDLQARGKAPERYFVPLPLSVPVNDITEYALVGPLESWMEFWKIEGGATAELDYYLVKPTRKTLPPEDLKSKSVMKRLWYRIRRKWYHVIYRCFKDGRTLYLSADLIRPV